MKKISIILAVLIFANVAIPVKLLACSSETKGQITGGACSIKELQQEERNSQQFKPSMPAQKRGFRTMRGVIQNPDSDGGDCLFENCLYQKLLTKMNKN